MLGVELVRDKKTKEPLARKLTDRIFQACARRGLLTMAYSPHFRLQPAITIDEATAMEGVAILGEVFDEILATRAWEAS
jgi:4-aminobutyrate aminotransferase-like enzyme